MLETNVRQLDLFMYSSNGCSYNWFQISNKQIVVVFLLYSYICIIIIDIITLLLSYWITLDGQVFCTLIDLGIDRR